MDKVLVSQAKFDGIRMCLHRKGNEIKIFTEDAKRDRAFMFPQILKEIKDNIDVDFICDSEFVIWSDNKPIPREQMMSLVVGKTPMNDDVDIHVNIHDVLWYDDKAINLEPYTTRLEYLDKLLPKDLKYLKGAKSCIITSRKSFDRCLKEAYDYSGSEGSVLKYGDSIYDVGKPRTDDWCIGGNTPILTYDGFKPAWVITDKDRILSKDGRFHKVLRVNKRTLLLDEKVFKVKPNHGLPFLISGNHEILTPFGWQSIEDTPAEVLITPFNIELPMVPKDIELSIMGYKKKINISTDFMRFLGFWVGDGSNNQKKANVTLSQKEVSVLKKYKSIVDSCFNINSCIYEYIERASILYFQDKPLSDWLSDNFRSVSRKGVKEKTIPWWIGNVSNELFSAFLDGLIESDGCTYDRVSYGTSSASLAGRLFVILRARGYNVSIFKRQPKKGNKKYGRETYRLTFLKNDVENLPLFDNRNDIRQIVDIEEHNNFDSDFLYDFEVENEESYRVPYLILHNSKIKQVKEVHRQIIGIQKKAMPFSSIDMDTPDKTIEGKEALDLYKKLTKESNTYMFRCALLKDNKLVPISSKKVLTDADFEIKFNADISNPKWQGLDDPRVWQMDDRFKRESGSLAFGNTYAFKIVPGAKLGDIITVLPVQILEFEFKESIYYSWMFPRIKGRDLDKDKPDSIESIQHLIRKE